MKLSSSFIFTRVTTGLFFAINIFAIYLLLRGHNFPGGGFIAGLGTGMSLILLTLAVGVERMHRILQVDPVKLAAVGLLLAILSSSAPILWGDEFLKQYNFKFDDLPIVGAVALGTPLVFDVGVYLVVVGVVVRLIAILARPVEGLVPLTEQDRAWYASPLEEPVETATADMSHDEEES